MKNWKRVEFADAEIMENCQNYTCRLAAWGLSSGASVVAVLLRGCDDRRWVGFCYNFSWD